MRQGRLLAIIGVLVFLAVAVHTLPASLLASRLPAAISLSGVSGSVWNGSATDVTASGIDLGTVRWTGSPLTALTGRLQFDASATTTEGELKGRVQATLGGKLLVEDTTLHWPLQPAGSATSAGWRGLIAGRIERIESEHGWPTRVVAVIDLNDLRAPGSEALLGNYRIEFDERSATAAGLSGRIRDVSGPMQVRAALAVRRDRTYLVEGEVAPRNGAPQNVLDTLAFLGPPDAQGRRPFSLSGTF
jgi:general secretion pathway protein N